MTDVSLPATVRTSRTEDVAGRVRHRFVTEGLAPTEQAVAAAVRAEPGAVVLGSATLARLTDRLHADLTGAGLLTPLIADPSVTDVLVNGPDEVWVDQGSGLTRTAVRFESDEEVRRFAQRLAAACGRRLDDGCPYVDGRLPDGTRLHAVLPPIAQGGTYLSLRTFRQRAFTLSELVEAGTVPGPLAPVLDAIVAARLPYLVTGGTGSGKTTLLATMLGLVPTMERIVVVEDAAELRPVHPHVVALQSRPANVEGAGEVTLRALVRQALRMRPDRLVVGECRGGELVDVLAALNTGHDGGAATLHANTPVDVPARLEALGLLGGLPRDAVHAQAAAALRVVLHMVRTSVGRRLAEVCLLSASGADRRLTPSTVWRDRAGTGPGASTLAQLFAQRGVAVPAALHAQGGLA